MRIFCLIAFVFLATSFTTNNENFENISKSETLEVEKPLEIHTIIAYEKGMGYNAGWEKAPIKVSITGSYGQVNMTVVEVYNKIVNNWQSVQGASYYVRETNSIMDGESVASQFSYKAGNYLYFNF